ncbi:Ig-like domain-containing protein [Gammaproteobacteria bacterium]|nr:Ig-like domain-containing protein [Gammaproteobacteria bacterium]
MKLSIKNAFLALSLFIITSCGGGGGGGGATPIQALAAVITSFVSGESSVIVGSSVDITWASTNATSCSASGSWSGSKSVNGSESVPISAVGANNFILTCNGEGGNSTKSISVEGYREIKGISVDGYISGASIFIDQNGNNSLDSDEDSTTSDNSGAFAIKHSNGVLISLGGQDIDTLTQLDQLSLIRNISGYSDSNFLITPVTSVDYYLCSNFSDECTGGGDINSVLGIDPSININTFDPVANKGDGGINDYLYEKGNQLTILASSLQRISNNLSTSSETTERYFRLIAETIDAEFNETITKVDIETNDFVSKVLQRVVTAKELIIDEDAFLNTSKALSNVMPLIAVNESNEITTALISFGLNKLQSDIVSIANGTADASVLNSYSNDIFNYIAEDQSIDSDSLVPDISSTEDLVTTNEDVAISINILANDSYTTSAPLSVSLSQPLNGTATLNGYIVEYLPNEDFNGSDSFTYSITQGTKSSTGKVTIDVNSINDLPVINIASSIQVEENQLAVTSITTSDADNDTLTLTMGGVDSGYFDLSSDDVLTFINAMDYETDQKSYSLNFTITDGTESVTKSMTVNLKNTNDNSPVIIIDSSVDVNENELSVTSISISDADNDTVSVSMSGSDANYFNLSSDNVLTFKNAMDFETNQGLYSLTFTASDGKNSTIALLAVRLLNVNDNLPVISVASSIDVEENQLSVTTIIVSDADNDSLSLSMSGEDSSQFNLTDDGVLSFKGLMDYEEDDRSYLLSFSLVAGSDTVTKDVQINLINVNDVKPEWDDGYGGTFPDGFGISLDTDENDIEPIGQVRAFDDIEQDTILYSLEGDDASLLSISSDGLVTFKQAPDYETKTEYAYDIVASDGVNKIYLIIDHFITNLNDVAPVITSESTLSADENQTVIGTVSISDPDPGTFSFVISGDDSSLVSINRDGDIRFITAPDYETKTSYSFSIIVSDGVNSSTTPFIININDLDDVFTDIAGYKVPTSIDVIETKE